MSRLLWLLLMATGLIVGCSSAQVSPSAPPLPATLTLPPKPGVDYVAIIGDSDTSGSAEGGQRNAGWPALVADQLEAQRITIESRVSASGTSGYVISKGAKARSFADRAAGAAGTNDQLVVVFGSRNDQYAVKPPTSSFLLSAAAKHTFDVVKAKAPQSRLLVIGPVWTSWEDADPSPEILLIRDVLRAQAEAASAVFVDPIGDRWFDGRPDLVGRDRINPTDQGHLYMSEKIAPIMAGLLRPTPSGP